MESTGQSETKRKRCAKCLNHDWETHKTRPYENQNFPRVAVPDVSRITATRVDGGKVNMSLAMFAAERCLMLNEQSVCVGEDDDLRIHEMSSPHKQHHELASPIKLHISPPLLLATTAFKAMQQSENPRNECSAICGVSISLNPAPKYRKNLRHCTASGVLPGLVFPMRVDGGEVNMAWPAGEVDKVLFIQYNTDLVDAREAEDRKSYGHNVAFTNVPRIAVSLTSASVRARRAMLDVWRVVPTEHVPGVAWIQRTEGHAFLAIARKHDFHEP
jgi:hypothetical protein